MQLSTWTIDKVVSPIAEEYEATVPQPPNELLNLLDCSAVRPRDCCMLSQIGNHRIRRVDHELKIIRSPYHVTQIAAEFSFHQRELLRMTHTGNFTVDE